MRLDRLDSARTRYGESRSGAGGATNRTQAQSRAQSFFCTKASNVARDPEFDPRCLELTLQRLAARGYRFVIPRPEQLPARSRRRKIKR